MNKITVNDLLAAGAHFGHQTKRWNPKMKKYVYGAKNGISIIDITKTMHQLASAVNFVQKVVGSGGDILFVGTKRQAQQIIKDAAEKSGMYHVSERWLGGTLTNNVTIAKSIAKMYEIDKLTASDEASGLKKKEIASLTRRSTKLHRDLDGIADMKKLPKAIIIVDVCHDDIAVREAMKLKIPVVAIVDTNGDPSNIDYPIAANDDAVKSIKVIIDVLTDAVCVAQEVYHKRMVEEKEAKAAAKAAKEKAQKEADDEAEKKKSSEKKAPAKSAAPKKAAEKNAPAKKGDDNKAEPKAAAEKTEKPKAAQEDKAPAEKAD